MSQLLQLTYLQTTFVVCPKWNVTADRSSDYPCHVSQILQLTNLQTTPDVSQILQMTNLQPILAVCPKYYIDKSSNYPRCVSQILQMTNLQTILVVCHKNITTNKCLDYFYIITLSGVTYSKIYYSVHLLHILTKETLCSAKELWVTVPLKWFDEIKCILFRSVQHSRMVCNNATEHAIL